MRRVDTPVLYYNQTIKVYTVRLPMATCRWKTPYCEKYCFNRTLPHFMTAKIETYDKKLHALYGNNENRITKDIIFSLRLLDPGSTVQIATRGDVFALGLDNVRRILQTIDAQKLRLHMYTRAWREYSPEELEEFRTRTFLSLDPWALENEKDRIAKFLQAGFYFTLFGAEEPWPGWFKCPKTFYRGIKCDTCGVCSHVNRHVLFKQH